MGIRSVTEEAIVREDGPDLGIEVHRGMTKGGESSQGKEEQRL